MKLLFVTTNDHKYFSAEQICKQFDIELERKTLDIIEIQSDDGKEIAAQKAADAFEQLKSPLVVTDDTWIIPGLNGFPGPYMKHMNGWLKPEDFLRLTKPLKDRRIILRPILVYQDANQQKIFSVDIEGVLLTEIRGSSKYPVFSIVSFDGGKNSVAELYDNGYSAIAERHTSWHELADWLKHKV